MIEINTKAKKPSQWGTTALSSVAMLREALGNGKRIGIFRKDLIEAGHPLDNCLYEDLPNSGYKDDTWLARYFSDGNHGYEYRAHNQMKVVVWHPVITKRISFHSHTGFSTQLVTITGPCRKHIVDKIEHLRATNFLIDDLIGLPFYQKIIDPSNYDHEFVYA